MTLEQRKASLAKLKQRTNCAKCGEVGHWAGDAKCRKSDTNRVQKSACVDQRDHTIWSTSRTVETPEYLNLTRGDVEVTDDTSRIESAPALDFVRSSHTPTTETQKTE